MKSWLVLLLFASVARADGPPVLRRGDELRFAGEVTEAGGRAGARFRKSYDLEVRVLVLDSKPGGADCALLTRLHPRLDDVVAGPVEAAAGGSVGRPPAAVRVEYVRVDYRGRVWRLRPEVAPAPLPSGPGVPASPFPPVNLDGVPLIEVGVFAPVPPRSQTTWTVAEANRPVARWTTTGETIWNGGRAWEIRRAQQSPDYDKPEVALTGWKRTDVVTLLPSDNVACAIKRRIEHRHGNEVSAWAEVNLERRPAARPTGQRLSDARREAELAILLAREFDALARYPAKPADYAARLVRVERSARDVPPGDFREGIESVARRWAAAAGGELPRVPPPEPTPEKLELGRAAPDFDAPALDGGETVSLGGSRGTPVALVFYRPGSKTAAESLAIAKALAAKYAGRLRVWPLAIYETAAEGYDGAPAQLAFGVTDYPRFCLIDSGGLLDYDAPGVGGETGYLMDARVMTLLGPSADIVTPAAPIVSGRVKR